jgi:antitoxin FitA
MSRTDAFVMGRDDSCGFCYHDSMTSKRATPNKPERRGRGQLLVCNIDLVLKEKLKRRAAKHGRSMEEEVRDILRDALKDERKPGKGLGTRIAERFKGLGLRQGDFPRLEIRPHVPKFD